MWSCEHCQSQSKITNKPEFRPYIIIKKYNEILLEKQKDYIIVQKLISSHILETLIIKHYFL